MSVVCFYHLSIALMKNFFAALSCRYPFRMWFVEVAKGWNPGAGGEVVEKYPNSRYRPFTSTLNWGISVLQDGSSSIVIVQGTLGVCVSVDYPLCSFYC